MGRIKLTDDGTLDTVLECADCGAEIRYSFNGDHSEECMRDSTPGEECSCYDDFVDWAIEDAEQEHECDERTLRKRVAKRCKVELDADGNLPAYAWPGGYPIVYYTNDGDTLCAKCAHTGETSDDPVFGCDVYWEGPPDRCANCDVEIESAYGDPESDDA